jgi:GNAT superfamily N-acetyltransferase
LEKESYSIISFGAGRLPNSYRSLIFSKWLRSLRYGNDYFRLINKDNYFKVYHRYVENILTAATVKFAVLAEDHDVVLGFSVSRDGILDYVHVHKDYRRVGLGTALLPSQVTIITHITRSGASLWHNRFPEAVFNPFI